MLNVSSDRMSIATFLQEAARFLSVCHLKKSIVYDLIIRTAYFSREDTFLREMTVFILLSLKY